MNGGGAYGDAYGDQGQSKQRAGRNAEGTCLAGSLRSDYGECHCANYHPEDNELNERRDLLGRLGGVRNANVDQVH